MKYSRVVPGTFVSRPNRFIARVMVNGAEETVHVKNTGRCRELLVPGARVYLSESDSSTRKTRYDLICVEKVRPGLSPLMVNMDSQVPNDVAAEWLHKGELFGPDAVIRREVTYGQSRFDLYVESGQRKIFMEVKGVTLEQDGVAAFPDAPTERGVKHLHELLACRQKGYEAYLLFVIQMKEIREIHPNDAMHPAFGQALREASAGGVTVLARDCMVTPDELVIDEPVKVVL